MKEKDKREKKLYKLFSDGIFLFCLFLIFKITWFWINFFFLGKTLKIIIPSQDSSSPAETTAYFYICHVLLYNLN